MSTEENPLVLSAVLTHKVGKLSVGLERGTAELYRWVTPVTAELLRWWFGNETVQSRSANFHPGQRQAILNVIVAHELLGSRDLADLYRQVCPWAPQGVRLAEAALDTHAHPRYCLKLATGTGKTWVLQALLVWQMLNKAAALDEAGDDPRFTHRFLIVAPGPMVCERLLDALLGTEREDRSRDFSTSELAAYADLFVPPARRERVERFVRGNVRMAQDLGLKPAANGLIAVTHRHLLGDAEADGEEDMDIGALSMSAESPVAPRQRPPSIPGRADDDPELPDLGRARGGVLAFLAELPDLMLFNVEGHRIHVSEKGGAGEAKWRKRLSTIAAGKGRRFVEMDFSATPCSDVDGGKRKAYSPHIVVDFDLRDALRQGLVKLPVLDRSKDIDALPPEFEAERDEHGNLRLSQAQRVMLRAGVQKLRELDADFSRVDPDRRPRMLVMCEDARVPPLVADFLIAQGLHQDDVVKVDSGSKPILAENEWRPLRRKLLDLDRHARPRVILSVSVPHEGFDAGTVCVIVPLRSGQARIPLEHTLGGGLRPMWRDPDYAELKRENRALIARGKAPGSVFDILCIVEHPAFQYLYDELLREGLAGIIGDDDGTGSTGDLIDSELREDHAQYDFAIPFVREADETSEASPIETVGPALERAQARPAAGDTEVRHRRLSEVAALKVRMSASLSVDKCIYPRLPYPARSGGLERAFIEWARTDASTQAFCGIIENRHGFMRLRYVTEDGLPAFYFPDFLVRTADGIYLAETKAQGQLGNPNVRRKLEAAAAWCERINRLPVELRGQRRWHYALVAEASFWEWRQNGARLGELLAFSKVMPAPRADAQGRAPPQG